MNETANTAHPYDGAYKHENTRSHNKVLTKKEMAQRAAEWVSYVDTARPLTKPIYKAMSKEDRKRYGRIQIWEPAGGLMVPAQRGKDSAMKAWKGNNQSWEDVALVRAKEKRRIARWSGKNFLISPSGIKLTSNGMPFGPFTLPGDEFALGKWDGVPKPGMKFTV